jgi:hypothetical protein
MISIHEQESNPQFISTSRHVMQGFVDMVRCEWNAGQGSLEGTSKVIGGEPYRVAIAVNGYRVKSSSAQGEAKTSIKTLDGDHGILELTVECEKGGEVSWSVHFEK